MLLCSAVASAAFTACWTLVEKSCGVQCRGDNTHYGSLYPCWDHRPVRALGTKQRQLPASMQTSNIKMAHLMLSCQLAQCTWALSLFCTACGYAYLMPPPPPPFDPSWALWTLGSSSGLGWGWARGLLKPRRGKGSRSSQAAKA